MKPLLVAATIAALIGAWGCQEPSKRLNAPPHGTTNNPSELEGEFTAMVDNGMLHDMTVNDSAFYPHRPMLNSLGTERLSRLVALMEQYGGVIRFNTAETDDALIAARVRTIMDFLADAGVDTAADVLERNLPGGRGMDANQAILIKAFEGTFQPGGGPSGGKPKYEYSGQ